MQNRPEMKKAFEDTLTQLGKIHYFVLDWDSDLECYQNFTTNTLFAGFRLGREELTIELPQYSSGEYQMWKQQRNAVIDECKQALEAKGIKTNFT